MSAKYDNRISWRVQTDFLLQDDDDDLDSGSLDASQLGTQSQAVEYASTTIEEDLIGYFTEVATGRMYGLRMSQRGREWVVGRMQTNWIYIPDPLVSAYVGWMPRAQC